MPFFEDVGTKTLEYLDSLFQVDNIQRSMFYKSLPQVIDKLPMVKFFSLRLNSMSFLFFCCCSTACEFTTYCIGNRIRIY